MTDDIKETTITVDAYQGEVPFWSYSAEGKKIDIGRVRYTDYDQDRNLRVMTFHPKSDDARKSTYRLGKGSGDFQIVDHVRAIDPLLDAGFVIENAYQKRAGISTMLILSHPEITMADFMGWDEGMHSSGADGGLRLSIGAKLDARAGRGYHYILGFFRLICGNGLIASALQLGQTMLSHTTFSSELLVDWVNKHIALPDNGVFSVPTTVYTADALEWASHVIPPLVYADEPVEPKVEAFPQFVQQPLNRFLSQPKWMQEGLTEQLQLAAQNAETVSTMDALNTITNVAATNPEQAIGRVYHNLDYLTAVINSIIEIGAFKSGSRVVADKIDMVLQ